MCSQIGIVIDSELSKGFRSQFIDKLCEKHWRKKRGYLTVFCSLFLTNKLKGKISPLSFEWNWFKLMTQRERITLWLLRWSLWKNNKRHVVHLISLTSLKLDNCCQQVISEHEPETPWHLQVTLAFRITILNEIKKYN